MDSDMKHQEATLYLRVLGYGKPDNTWAAHCLETDLVGYGRTFQAALANLIELTEMQISFAIYKNQPALLDRPAPAQILETYNSLLRASLERFTQPSLRDRKHYITSIPWPESPTGVAFALA